MKCALYARYSTERQSENSIPDQLRTCERLAEREGFQIVARFSDAAISGGTAQRPGYMDLLRAARRHEFDVIVAEDSSRLWRELAEQWRALKELQDLGVHFVGHGIDTRRDESKILLAVNGAMAEAYRDEIARRTRRGLEGRALAGAAVGGRAYGYIAARDSGTGRVEINETEATVVRQIFELYAGGLGPRRIAAQLNGEGIPSPGSSWNRTTRRRAGWLASAIHGDVTRESGILNCRRYIGIVTWGRTRWERSAADSSKRRARLNAKPLYEVTDERFRIIPQELWERVKARQARQRESLGARVRGKLPHHAPGQGRSPRHVLSGLLRCGLCDAKFTMADARAYACASYLNGHACTNHIRVRRIWAEDRILDSVRRDLRDPEVIAEVERRVIRALARPTPEPDTGRRIADLQRQVGNLADAIALDGLKGSVVLAQRLAAAEAELERLQREARAGEQLSTSVGRMLPRVGERYLAIVERLVEHLAYDPEHARPALVEAIGERITLTPDVTGKFLWAEYGLESAPMLVALGVPEIMVAGARSGRGIKLI
jgi:DNA invertase Pin-like site-specific DNA recombinase